MHNWKANRKGKSSRKTERKVTPAQLGKACTPQSCKELSSEQKRPRPSIGYLIHVNLNYYLILIAPV